MGGIEVTLQRRASMATQGVVSADGGVMLLRWRWLRCCSCTLLILTGEKWNGNTAAKGGVCQNVMHCSRLAQVAQGRPHVAPCCWRLYLSANNAAKESGVRNPGYAKVAFASAQYVRTSSRPLVQG